MRWPGRRDKEPEIPQPEWAQFMSPADWRDFAADMTDGVRRDRPGDQLLLDQGFIKQTNPQLTRGLLNLAQMYAQYPVSDRATLIRDYLAFQPDTADKLTFDDAAALLRVRLYANDVPSANWVTAPLSDSFTTMLAIDLPTAMVSVSKEWAANWSKDADELFQVALANTLREVADATAQQAGEGESELRMLHGESFYVASAVLLPLPFDPPADHGFVAAVPSRHIAVVHPLRGAGNPNIIPVMRTMAGKAYTDGPGSITPNLIWVRNGQFRTMPVKDDMALADVPATIAGILRL